MWIKSLAQGENILMPGFEQLTSVTRNRHSNQYAQQANNEQDKLQIWLRLNKLSINVNKTNYILFSNKKGKQDNELKLSDFKIKR